MAGLATSVAQDIAWALYEHTFFNTDTGRPFLIPCVALFAGTVLLMVTKGETTVGKLILYFGAQSFMNIYMGWVMRTSVTLESGTFIEATNQTITEDLTGCPAGFALTALQQVVSFIVFGLFFAARYFTKWRYTPKKLNSWFEVFCVIIFGCVFALNIALNNSSLGYISIALNLSIRSCLPLTTLLSQQGLALFGLYPKKPCRPLEILLMTIGVFCAGSFTTAKIMASESKEGEATETSAMLLGVFMCIASLLCGSLNLALAGVLGETKLNVYDTVAYMAIPATMFLMPIAMFVPKPVPGEWSKVFGQSEMTDFEILRGVWSLNQRTMAWLILSGVFSFVYNIIQFSIVHTLSPSATAFGGNFNKAALIFLTLLLPFLHKHALPGSPYIQVIWISVIVNIAAFSYYSWLQIQWKKQDAENAKLLEQDGRNEAFDDESEEESSSSASSSEEVDLLGSLMEAIGLGSKKQHVRNLTTCA